MGEIERFKLDSLNISGYKSFNSEGQSINFKDVAVLIGANGSGKSSLISFFKMLKYMMGGHLENFVGTQAGASSILHYGPKVTPKTSAAIAFSKGNDRYEYKFEMGFAARDTLVFELENFNDNGKDSTFSPGGNEAKISWYADPASNEKLPIVDYLFHCEVFEFQDTSQTSRFRQQVYINDNAFMSNNGGNLPSYLYGLKENPDTKYYYERILRHIRMAFPQFGDFVLEPSAQNKNYIILNWYEKAHQDYVFGPHQLSDGTLRFIALATLLLQPPEKLDPVIIIDEPELGLHPSAIIELASMVKMASQHSQIILATQSPALLDQFEPEQVAVIERDPVTQSSIIKEFNREQLAYWLDEYTLSEIWDKNILGGRP